MRWNNVLIPLIPLLLTIGCEDPDTEDSQTETVVPRSHIDAILDREDPSKSEDILCRVTTEKVPGGEDVCNYKCPDGTFGLCWRNPAGSWDCSECSGSGEGLTCESWTANSGDCPYL